MDSMEVNKVIAAVLVAGIVFFVTGLVGDSLVHETVPRQAAIKIETAQTAGPAQPQPTRPPLAPLLAKADVAAGDAYAHRVCVACHTFDEGGKAGVGPNLYGVVGAPHGHMAGFNYSTALKDKQGPWTFDELNEWLEKPSAYAPGTRMAFAGIANAQERANVIDWLNTLSPHPEPLPSPEAPPAAAAPAPAAASGDPPIATLLPAADAQRGEADTKKYACFACHTFTEGGKAGVGPNLYGILGAPHAHMQGFAYSDALKSKQGPWTYDELYEWLKKPSAYAPGTKMTFPGASDPKDRADIIAYLRSLSPNPEPLPAQ
ncbi:MAG TPA: cytochrome c family protein [Acetobacteraceae bacterium]|nr:cytochrome c family protein [Acetobacteraceae bacterium]